MNDSVLNALGAKVMAGIAAVVVKNYKLAKDDIYAFLSSLTGLDIEEIAHLKLSEYISLIIQVCKKEDFIDSFKAASSLLG